MAVLRMREALRDAMAEEMRRDEEVFVMGEDVAVFQGAFKVTEGLLDEFGEKRVRDTPISENTIVGTGVGAAMGGLRPIVELMTVNFSLLAFDQIINHAAAIPYMFNGQAKVPMVIRMPGGGGHQLGPTHSHSFEAMYLQIPGVLVACPSTPADGKGLLKAAIRDDNPVIFIEHETLYGARGDVPEDDDHTLNFGDAAIRREGTDVTIVGILRMAHVAEQAAKTLSHEHGVEAELIDPAHPAPARPRHDPRVGAQDEPPGRRRGGLAARRGRRQHRRARPRAGVRPPRRPDPAGDRRRCADALLEATRAVGDPPRGERRERRPRDHRGSPLMAEEIVMPRLSDSMEEGTILKWMKGVGDEVALGDELVEIETDKANMVFEADAAGTLIEIVAGEGDTLPIGEVIARVGEASEARPRRPGAPTVARGAATVRVPRRAVLASLLRIARRRTAPPPPLTPRRLRPTRRRMTASRPSPRPSPRLPTPPPSPPPPADSGNGQGQGLAAGAADRAREAASTSARFRARGRAGGSSRPTSRAPRPAPRRGARPRRPRRRPGARERPETAKGKTETSSSPSSSRPSRGGWPSQRPPRRTSTFRPRST